MTPPTRRNAGKGRGRGGRGERRPSGDRGEPPKSKRERERERGAKRGGRGGGASSSASARPTRAVTTVLKKLVVRNIPPEASEEEARTLLETHGVGPEFVWRFVPGRKRSNNRQPTPARLYLDMKKEPEKARKLIAALHGQMFYPEAKEGDATPLDVEFAPFQKIPREKQRKDAKVGTLDRDPEYMAFLEELSKPKDKLPSAEAAVDMAEGETVEKPMAALVKYLNERKAHSREKGKGKSGKALDKNGARRQTRKKDGLKQKGTKDKKTAKDRLKKNSGDAASAQDSTKPRKQRIGRTNSKKELPKQEATEPGMLRIMPKSAGDSAATTTPNSNGTPQSADTVSERGSEKRGPKGGKQNGDRGRGGKKARDYGDGAGGEGIGAADSKPHPRRKGGNSGKKEPNNGGKKEPNKKESNNRGERKKKVFAPKDATAQGTPAKKLIAVDLTLAHVE